MWFYYDKSWSLIEWWSERPPWLRTTIALIIMAVGLWLVYIATSADDEHYNDRRAIHAGMVFTLLGTILLLVGGKTEAEKKGYRF